MSEPVVHFSSPAALAVLATRCFAVSKGNVRQIAAGFSRDEKKQDDMRSVPRCAPQVLHRGCQSVVWEVLAGGILASHALKQVPSCEFYPSSDPTNSLGTDNVLQAAERNG